MSLPLLLSPPPPPLTGPSSVPPSSFPCPFASFLENFVLILSTYILVGRWLQARIYHLRYLNGVGSSLCQRLFLYHAVPGSVNRGLECQGSLCGRGYDPVMGNPENQMSGGGDPCALKEEVVVQGGAGRQN